MKSNIVILIVVAFVVLVAFTVTPKDYHYEKNPIIEEIKLRFGALSPEYAKIPMRVGKKSFTEDKSVITLCIQNPKTAEFYDINVLMYVALHELSHCITKAEGDQSHGDEFKTNFDRLLKEAARKGVYDPKKPIPPTYCGIEQD